MSTEFPGQWQFGEFKLDVRRKVLRHREQTVQMPLKELELLCMLVRHGGELVTKDEMLNEIWEDSYVEESNLSRHIYLLRKTLRSLGASDGLIENVPRRGYRFTGEAQQVGSGEIVLERHTQTRTLVEFSDAPTPRSRFSGSRLSVITSALVLIAIAGFLGYRVALTTEEPTRIKSIAVLPFKQPPGASHDATHLGSGFADILTTRLSRLKDIKVRPASAGAGLEDIDAVEAGKQLSVDAVLDGTIYRSGDRTRVTARLIDVRDASIIWSGEFDRLMADELAIQSDVAQQIFPIIAINLSQDERNEIAKLYTDEFDAYALYLRGRHEWNKRTGPSMLEARHHFRNAITADPNFALAYVGLADTSAMNRAELRETNAAIAKAIELDPNLAEPHATRGFILMFHEREWAGAEAAFRRSLELNPNYATAHHWYATLLAIQGKIDDAKLEMHRALEIDPLSHNFIADLGQIHYFAGEYEEAERLCLRALELYPDFAFAHQYLYYIYVKTGNHDRAIEEIIKAERIITTLNNAPAKHADVLRKMEEATRNAYKEGGVVGYLERHLGADSSDPDSFYFFAIKHTLKGENEKALDYLERSTDGKMFLSAFVKADPIFERLREEPRYQQILRKMRLV